MMTLDEARTVAAICSKADHGCVQCVDALADALQEKFPQFIWEYNVNFETGIHVEYNVKRVKD